MSYNPYKPENPENVVYRRNPTPSEIRFGHGATHYAEFSREECTDPKTGKLKKWFKSPYDNLRYYR